MVCKNCGNAATTTMSMNDGYMGSIGNTQAHLCNDCHRTAMKEERKKNVQAAAVTVAVFVVGAHIVGGLLLLG